MAVGGLLRTYTKEIQNGIRVAALLINEGTQVVRVIFDKEVNSEHGSLEAALIKCQAQLKSNPGKVLTYPQMKKLYPNKKKPAKVSDDFDLTLLTALLPVICDFPLPKKPATNDFSTSADLIRLRNFRNSNYGHLAKGGFDEPTFQAKWTELSDILIRLGASQEDCDKWKYNDLEPEDIEDYQKQIQELIQEDITCMQSLAIHLINAFDSMKMTLKGDMQRDFEDLKAFADNHRDYNEFIGKTIIDMTSDLGKQVGVQSYMLEVLIKNVNHHGEETKRLLTGLAQETETMSHNIQEILDEQKFQSEILHRLKQIEPAKLILDPHLKVIHDVIVKHVDNSFKVLIVNEPKPNCVDPQLGEALGYVPWDVVIDLDHKAMEPSTLNIFDRMRAILGKHKTPLIVNYQKCQSLSEQEKEAVAKGSTALWIRANGCELTNCPQSLKRFAQAKINIQNLLNSIVKKIPSPKTGLCLTLLLNEPTECKGPLSKLQDMMEEVFECARDNIRDDPDFVGLGCADIAPNCVPGHDEMPKAVASDSQLRQMFNQIFHQDLTKSFTYPGNKGECFLSCEELTQWQTSVELYHHKIGEMDFKGCTDEEISSRVADVVGNFQKGSIITSEALYLHAENRALVYVKRNEMRNLEETLAKELDRRNIKSQKQGIMYFGQFTLHHDPCGGATTCVRHLLYHFRKQYPCIELKQNDENMYAALKSIYKNSSLPLLLVADSRFTYSEIVSLRKRLTNDFIQGLVLYTKRIPKRGQLPQRSQTHDEIHFPIPVVIEDQNDLAAFKELYKKGQSKKRAKSVFLFGLLAFLKDYQKCQEHIQVCIDALDSNQKRMTRMICYMWKYCHVGVKAKLLGRFRKKFLDTKEQISLNDVIQILGSGSDFLINANEDHENIIRPAVDFIVEPILDCLDSSSNKQESFNRLIEDFKSLVDAEAGDIEDSAELIGTAFIKRDWEIRIHFSDLITDLEDATNTKYVQLVLTEFSDLLADSRKGAHVRTLLARYLMRKMRNPEEAIVQMKMAVGLKADESIQECSVADSVLLSAYGHIFQQKVTAFFSQNLKRLGVKSALNIAQCDTQEAIYAFEKAQSCSWGYKRKGLLDPMPFWAEAGARYTLLHYHFLHEPQCQKNVDQFAKFLQSSNNSLLQESEKKGMEALQNLEIFLDEDRIYETHIGFTKDKIIEVKFNFLRLHAREEYRHQLKTNPKSLEKTIREMSSSAPCDIGRMIIAVLGKECSGRKPNMNDLKTQQLDFIITEIDKRIHRPAAVLAHNYHDIIMAMIILSQRGILATKNGKLSFNTQYAIQCAMLWVERNPRDHEAHFMLGVLKFIEGLDQRNARHIHDAITSLNKCREICEKRKTTWGYRKRRFFISTGEGLQKLLPSIYNEGNEDTVPHGCLQTFTGRLICEGKKFYKIHVDLKKMKPPFTFKANVTNIDKEVSSDVNIKANQQPLVDCFISFAHDMIIAFNVVMHEEYMDSDSEDEADS